MFWIYMFSTPIWTSQSANFFQYSTKGFKYIYFTFKTYLEQWWNYVIDSSWLWKLGFAHTPRARSRLRSARVMIELFHHFLGWFNYIKSKKKSLPSRKPRKSGPSPSLHSSLNFEPTGKGFFFQKLTLQ